MNRTQERAKAYLEEYRREARSTRRQQKPGGETQFDADAVADIRELLENRQTRLCALRKDILAKLSQLPADEQDVLVERYIRGMSWHDVAEKNCISESTVYRLHRAGLLHLGDMLSV